jgi:hypothetical protein
VCDTFQRDDLAKCGKDQRQKSAKKRLIYVSRM